MTVVILLTAVLIINTVSAVVAYSMLKDIDK